MRRAAILAGTLSLAACSSPQQAGRQATAAATSPDAAGVAEDGSPSPEAVVRAFVTAAMAGHEAAHEWDGGAAGLRGAMAAIGPARGAVTVGAGTDGDAGMGQRHVTVPFAIGGTGGRAVLHRVADGIESDDPRAQDWRIRTLAFPANAAPVPAAGNRP